MAIATLYDYTGAAYVEIEESYLNVGASNFSLGTIKRAFKDSTLEIWTGAGKTGTELIVDTDFTIETNDAFYGSALFTELNVSNVTYQTGTVYISYQPYGSYDEKATVDGLRTDVDINTVHSTGDGSDHADVATNTAANAVGRLVVFQSGFLSATTEDTVFDLIQSYVPTTGNYYQCDGWFGTGYIWLIKRHSATRIDLFSGLSSVGRQIDDGAATAMGADGHIVI